MGRGGAKRVALVLAVAPALAACGGGARQDADEPEGTFPVRIVQASFPAAQRLARTVELRVEVRNAGRRTIPNLALTVRNRGGRPPAAAFPSNAPGVAGGGARTVWILEQGPRGGDTAYDDTWALGPLPPGGRRAFTFRLTPQRTGRFAVGYRVAAGLDGKARAVAADGGPAQGGFRVRISGTPTDAISAPAGGG